MGVALTVVAVITLVCGFVLGATAAYVVGGTAPLIFVLLWLVLLLAVFEARPKERGPGHLTARPAGPHPFRARSRSEELARVENAPRVEDVLHGPLHLEPDGADLARQPLLLQYAYAVFAGDGAA